MIKDRKRNNIQIKKDICKMKMRIKYIKSVLDMAMKESSQILTKMTVLSITAICRNHSAIDSNITQKKRESSTWIGRGNINSIFSFKTFTHGWRLMKHTKSR